MADTTTPNLNLVKPEIGVVGATSWAQKNNDNFDKIDAGVAAANTAASSAGTAASNANTAASNAAPPGAVLHFARNTAPTGWLKANGAAISRTTYAALFAAIGTTFGTGDGSTTFNLPDLRGYFLRSLDDGRGVDSSRAFGSTQADLFASHGHSIPQTPLYAGGSSYWVPNDPGQGYLPLSPTGLSASANGGTETRPKNIALLACIKF